MTDLVALDAEARDLALDPSRSILLEAPAGSGKTTVLTQRILRLLALVDEPEEVLAITFTRKAAAEMRERVLEALRGTEPVTTEHARRTSALAEAVRVHSARRNWGLEQNPARLRIQTIDSLNHSIASRLPIAARAGGQLAVHDRSEDLHRLAARRTLEDAEAMPELVSDLGLLFDRLDNDWRRFEGLLAEMLNRRAHWLPLLGRTDAASLTAIVEQGLREVATSVLRVAVGAIPAELLRQAAAFAPLHAIKCDRAAARLLEAGARWPPVPAAQAEDLPWWQCLASLALTREGEWRKRLNANEGFPPAEATQRDAAMRWLQALMQRPGAREALVAVTGLPPTAIDADDAGALEALARVLRFAAAELEVIFQEQGRVDHSYVALAAKRALEVDGEPTDLALRLGTAIRHVLIDEFQDTSSEQFELVRALTVGWEEGDGRTLFAVGDPMQSIYQFREAEVGLFLRARDYGIGGVRLKALRLTRNFRSVPALVEWGNQTFARIFPSEDEPRASAVRHAPSVPARAPADGGALHLHRVPAGDPTAEAARIATLVADIRQRDPKGTVAILVAARQHAAPVTSALLAVGIPVTGIDLVPLAEVPVVRDLAALTRALEHPADRTAWLAVLRAPWCGLTLAEFVALLDPRDPATVWEALHRPDRVAALEAPTRARLERVRAVLERALAAQGRLALAAWVESTWLALGGPSTCLGPEDSANAEAFLRVLAQRSSEPGWTGADALDDLLDSLYASNAGAPADAVQIMTMHRAKGLEFDRVILPSLGRRPRAGREALLRWLDLPREREGSDLLLAPCPAASRRTPEPLNEFLKRLQKRRAGFERARLLYVATTRARLELHLLGQTDRRHPERPVAGTLLALLWPVIGEAFLATGPATDPIELEPGDAAVAAPQRALRRLPAGWVAPAAAPGTPFSGLRVANYEPAVAPEFDWVGQTARHVGTVVHAALERIGRLRSDPGTVDIGRLAPSVREALAAQGVTRHELTSATLRALEALGTLLADERGRWILDPRHREAASELALTGLLGGRLVSVSIDRSFIDAAGERWVVDFKTSSHEGTDLEAFLAAEIERYRPQLTRYAALARGLGPERVRAALYFPLLAAFRECPLDAETHPPGNDDRIRRLEARVK